MRRLEDGSTAFSLLRLVKTVREAALGMKEEWWLSRAQVETCEHQVSLKLLVELEEWSRVET